MVRVVDNPETPFVSVLDTDWVQTIIFKGKSTANPERFSVYLQNGQGFLPDEIPFHVDFRFNYGGSRKIVMSYRKDGEWQAEELHDGPFPLTEEQNFEVKIVVEKDSFKTRCIRDFDHSFGQSLVRYLSVHGPIVKYKEKIMVRVVDNPDTPFVSVLDTDWIQTLIFKGKTTANPERFSVFLQKGLEYEPDEIPFHVDFRFNYSGTRKVLMNYRKDGKWQTEEIYDGPFPLTEEQNFEIKIIVEKDSFKVNVNGTYLMEYQQKMSCKSINCFRIDHDIKLVQVKME